MMNELKLTICVLGLSVSLAGCGGPKYEGDQRFPLSGTATLDGQPIDLGSIALIPMGAAPGKDQSASGGIIQDGKYSIPEESGPNAGNYRVEVHWLKLTGKQLLDAESGEMYDERKEALPPKYHKDSELTLEAPAPDHIYNLELTSS
jgi:hypothetical protein